MNCLDDNLRICEHCENTQNRGKQRNNTSGQKGVIWNKYSTDWEARITTDYRQIHLGHFNTALDAARAYNDAAIKYFGEFAVLNDL